jgi:hypothetical protein
VIEPFARQAGFTELCWPLRLLQRCLGSEAGS